MEAFQGPALGEAHLVLTSPRRPSPCETLGLTSPAQPNPNFLRSGQKLHRLEDFSQRLGLPLGSPKEGTVVLGCICLQVVGL